MADPLSVLGASAAALQIASQAFTLAKDLWRLFDKIGDAPELKKSRTLHIEQLIELSKLVAKTPPLQTAGVQKVLVACLRTIVKLRAILENYCLEDIGKIKKIMNALKMVNREDDIAMLFATIEREKSLLALSIHQIDAAQLQTISTNVTDLQTSIDNAALIVTDTAHHVQTMVKILPDIGNQVQGVCQEVPKLAAGIEAIQEHFNITSISTKTATEVNLDAIYVVPNRCVRDFVGRESVLAQIDTSFRSESDIGPRIVVLRAMGGQGKTQIALEYCRRRRAQSDAAVFWVDASSESSLQQSYSTISEILATQTAKLPDVNSRVNFTLRKLTAWPSAWLIVLDNYDNPTEFNNIMDYVPENEQGMVLITSRHADAIILAKGENRIELPGLIEPEAVDLLLTHGNRKQPDFSDFENAKAIVKRLGYHPLAIAQAGAYIHKRKLPLKEFLDHFQRRKAKIMNETTPQMSQYRRRLGGAERETSLSVFATWELSYQQLLAEDTDDMCIADLLTLIAFFASDGVPENILKAYSKYPETVESHSSGSEATNGNHCPYRTQRDRDKDCSSAPGAFLFLQEENWNSDMYCDALATMAQLSLVEGFSKVPNGMYEVTLHPLVRDWIRLRTDSAACAQYTFLSATCIYRLLQSGMKNENFILGFSVVQELLKHIDAHLVNLAEFISQTSNMLDESRRNYLDKYDLDFGNFYWIYGKYVKAREVYELCLARRNKEIMTNDLVTRRLLAGLSYVLNFLGEYKNSEETIKMAYDMSIQANGKEHEETLRYMCDVGSILMQGLPEDAEEYVKESVRLCEQLLGKEDIRTLRCMRRLGDLLYYQAKSREAEEVYRQLLRVQEVVLEKEHSDTMIVMHNLALVLARRANWMESEDLYRQLLKILEKVFGKGHPARIIALINLADLMSDMGRGDEAKMMFMSNQIDILDVLCRPWRTFLHDRPL